MFRAGVLAVVFAGVINVLFALAPDSCIVSAEEEAQGISGAVDKEQELNLNRLIQAAGYLCEQKCKEEANEYRNKKDDYDEKNKELEESKASGLSQQELEKLRRKLVETRAILERNRAKYIECLKGCKEKSSDQEKEESVEGSGNTALIVGGIVAVAAVVAVAVSGGGGESDEGENADASTTEPTTTEPTTTEPTTTEPTTAGECDGVEVGGACWYLGNKGESCDDVCYEHGDYNDATMNYAGSKGTNENCGRVLLALNAPGAYRGDTWTRNRYHRGCYTNYTESQDLPHWHRDVLLTYAAVSDPEVQRACACNE